VIDKKNMKREEIQAVMNEISILQEVDHPNIVRYLETFEERRFIYLVMESCPGGELFDSREIILKNGKSFTERQSCEIIKKCLSALNHCHKLNVIHRDIKPENMMFGKDGDIRLVDFGLA
jgi:calcium-dependent protein kinase